MPVLVTDWSEDKGVLYAVNSKIKKPPRGHPQKKATFYNSFGPAEQIYQAACQSEGGKIEFIADQLYIDRHCL